MVEIFDYGFGVVLFRNSFKCDTNAVISELQPLKKEAFESDFTVVTDDNGEPLHVINRGGFIYGLDHVNKSPIRIQNISSETQEIFERATYEHLIQYIELYPQVLQCLWWKIKGHVLAYETGASLGTHCDNDVNYRYGQFPRQENAVRSVVSAILFINGHAFDSESENANNYSGGELRFEYLKQIIIPKEGDIMFFPSNYVGAHEILEITKGTRYTYLSLFAQGSAQPDKGINPEISATGSGGQEWLTRIIEDYDMYIKSKHSDGASFELVFYDSRFKDDHKT